MIGSGLFQSSGTAAPLLTYTATTNVQAAQAETSAQDTPGATIGTVLPNRSDPIPPENQIIVTANRPSQSALSIPSNISAVSESALSAAGITDANDLSRLVQGLSVFDVGMRASGK